MKCYNCGNTNLQEYQDTCPNCNSYVHCCMNCKFYDENQSSKCRIQGKWENDKRQKNYCTDWSANTGSW